MRTEHGEGPAPWGRGPAVRITILVTDEAAAPLIAEHGLALWVEVRGQAILFDTGAGGALAPNARALGVDLGRADAVVLSHGHFDHGGGLGAVLRAGAAPEVYAHAAAARAKYEVNGGRGASIGLPDEAAAALAAVPSSRMHWVSGPVEVGPGIGLTGPIPRESAFEGAEGPFFLDPGGSRPDPMEDDQALWIDTPDGLVVCVGCAHAGIVNTLHYALGIRGASRIRAVVGGFHLLDAGEERLGHTVRALRGFAPDRVAPCHCTGRHATARIGEALGGRFCAVRAGSRLVF
jgi:7,8-dihydropterin-6-yl-methyl-4-(beta-D-ribofuranosyl)aminobenzene 5'-phosphate synthase